MTPRTIAVGAETVQTRKLGWAEFYRIRPDLKKPMNDNDPEAEQKPPASRKTTSSA